MRLFVSVDLDEPTRAAVVGIQSRVRDLCAKAGWRVSWVRPAALHITLKFLGDVEPERLPEVRRIVSGEQVGEPFPLVFRGVSTFPPRGRPRVVFVDVEEGRAPLTALAEGLSEAFSSLGFPREERPFHPHLTLGRVKQARAAHGDVLEPVRDVSVGEVTVSSIRLYRSHLSSEGARYEDVTT